MTSVAFPQDGYQLVASTENIEGQLVDVVTFYQTLTNGAEITIANYLFKEEGSVPFAGQTVPTAGLITF